MSNTTEENEKISWDEDTKKKFDFLISKIPIVLRSTAKRMITPKAESIAKGDGRSVVCEKDMVDAFFDKVPASFHVAMKNDMRECNIDWTQYGHPE
jgi:hypothetical protein